MTTSLKTTRSTLDVVNNTYVIRNGLLYEYYSISVSDWKEGDKFIRLEISPGKISPGIAIVDKQLYDVSLEDLYRRRINVAKRHSQGNKAGATAGKSDVYTKKAKNTSGPKANPEQQRSGTLFGIEVSEAADLAFENQIDSLLEAFLAKEGEEFEVTSSAQSGRSNAVSSASHMFDDLKLD